MDDVLFNRCTCSECGREMSYLTQSNYQYKTNRLGKTEYQCGYTCYDHALLKYEDPDDYYPRSKFGELVDKCERAMIGQGKTILHPITHK